MSVHDGEDSSSVSDRMSSKSKDSRSRSYNRDHSRSRTTSRSRERYKYSDSDRKRSWVIFVRNLHHTCSNEDLRKHFDDCGIVLDASVIRDRKHGKLKGFGFVAFETERGQKQAILDKNGSTLLDKNIVVQVSTRKTTVYIGNLPYDFASEKDQDELQTLVESRCGRRISHLRLKGRYAFCEFVNFEQTQAALQKLPGMIFRGRELKIQLANSTRAEEDMMSSDNLKKTLFVRNISQDVSERELRHQFSKYGDLTRCEIMRDRAGEQREYGFVAFKERSQTEHAYRDMHRMSLGGREIIVEYAKAKDSSSEKSYSRKRNSYSKKSNSRDSYPRDRRDRRRYPRSRSRESYRSSRRERRNDSDNEGGRMRRPVTRLEIDDVLARGLPVLAYDSSVGRMVLLSPDSKRFSQRRDRGRRGYE